MAFGRSLIAGGRSGRGLISGRCRFFFLTALLRRKKPPYSCMRAYFKSEPILTVRLSPSTLVSMDCRTEFMRLPLREVSKSLELPADPAKYFGTALCNDW